MVDPRTTEFLQVLGPFTERMQWLLPESRRGEPVPVEEVKILLAEWEELERNHLPLPDSKLQAIIDPILTLARGWRARIQGEFLLKVFRMLEAWSHCRSSEQMMKLPGVIKQRLAEGRAEEVMPLLDSYREARGSEFDAEVAFRAMMATADKKEELWQTQVKELQREWPAHWTSQMQARLDAGDHADLKAWHSQLLAEMKQIAQDFPAMVTPPPEMA